MTKDSFEDKIIEPLTKLCINHINQTETIIRANIISINFWTMERNSLLDNEPPKIFKKKYQEWKTKLDEVNEHLEDLYNSKDETTQDLKDLKYDLN